MTDTSSDENSCECLVSVGVFELAGSVSVSRSHDFVLRCSHRDCPFAACPHEIREGAADNEALNVCPVGHILFAWPSGRKRGTL